MLFAVKTPSTLQRLTWCLCGVTTVGGGGQKMCETCWVGGNFAQVAARGGHRTVGSMEATAASFRAVEYILDRELQNGSCELV